MRRGPAARIGVLALATVAVAAAAAPALAVAQEPVPRDLDAWIREGMEARDIPGLALAVVRDDSVAVEKGYGVRRRGEGEPVDARTLFAIGSATKAFTAAVVGDLVTEGAVGWDDPVREHLPWFRLPDPYRSENATVRDLLAHRTGLARTPFLVLNTGTTTREEVVRRVRHAEMSRGFREGYGYQNVMYAAAGLAAGASAGTTWEELVRRRLISPLGMERTITGRPDETGNVAAPHVRTEDGVRTVPWRDIGHVGPAGSLVSSVRDMARWLRLHLGHGTPGGTPVLDSAVVAEMRTPQSLVPPEAPVSAYLFSSLERQGVTHTPAYGLGWYVLDYRGERLVLHGGDIDGMAALVAMLPGRDVGVVVLTNLQSQFFPYAVALRIFDHALAADGPGWGRVLRRKRVALEEQQRELRRRREDGRVAGTEPSLPTAGYTGRYRSPLHGGLEVSAGEAGLILELGPAMVADLEHWHYDTWRVRWRNPALREASMPLVTFRLGPEGQVEELELTGPGRTIDVFERERSGGVGSP